MSDRQNLICISVNSKGELAFIHDDRLRGLLSTGEAKITRASHVEPGDPEKGQDPLQWYATMVNGPVLGPYPTRTQALDEEVKWLHQHNLGRPTQRSGPLVAHT